MNLLANSMGSEQWTAIVSRGLCLVATLWIAWTLAGLAWLASGHNGAVVLHEPPRMPHRADVDVTKLASLNLFGLPPVAAAQGQAANAPDTTLQLRLAGVFVNADPAKSSAVIAERNNPSAPTKAYGVNESLPGGAMLSEVYDDRVLLKRGGVSEVLRFEKTGLLAGNNGGSAATERDSAGDEPSVRTLLDTASESLRVAPEAFVQQMGLKAGAMGYEITANTPEELRSALGLQPGDQIVSVNGRRLGDPVRDRDVLAALKARGSARVEVQRGSQTVIIERKF